MTISGLGGILWFMLRTRLIVGPMARTIAPQDVAGLIHYFIPINNNNYNRQDKQQVAQRNLFYDAITTVSQMGCLAFMLRMFR